MTPKEKAYWKIQSKILGLDRELFKNVDELIKGDSELSDELLKVVIESTERELRLHQYILSLIINDIKKN
jgi:hypothetical protein